VLDPGQMRVLVTGGAGYIGSHMVRVLLRSGHHVVVVDDLSTGHEDTIPEGTRFVRTDIRAHEAVVDLLREEKIDSVFHFASRIQVGESVTDPRLYFRDNLAAGVALLEAVLDAKVTRFILSSTAAVYGDPIRVPIDEAHPTSPVNPYGETKRMLEQVLARYASAYGLRYAALRYFNAAGADVAAGLRERHDPETHLVPLVLDAALGKRTLTVFGEDYETEDGTCVRDYIHVLDLARAHLAALSYLDAGGASGAFNLGTGRGHSVREVIACAERVTGRKIPFAIGPRRPGDPPVLVASPERAKAVLGWAPERPSLDDIVGDAWACQRGN
jgi:UDP-glucose 4-epimerase